MTGQGIAVIYRGRFIAVVEASAVCHAGERRMCWRLLKCGILSAGFRHVALNWIDIYLVTKVDKNVDSLSLSLLRRGV